MRLPLALTVLFSCVAATQAQSGGIELPRREPVAFAPLQASISIDAKQILGPVNRKIFGHNIEAANGKNIFGPSDTPNTTRAADGFWNPDANAPVLQAVQFTRDIGASVLRYPGGCLAHGFNWKETIGPLQERPQWAFGLDEYLKLCAATRAEPLITVADYTGTPQDAADLVEYLNAPADGAHAWALKRAANGHAASYEVKYFEMGNETDHGNHDLLPRQKWTAAQYAAWFNECAAKMRAIDPKIKIGALMGTGTGPGDLWNPIVLSQTKGRADFIIVHTYVASVWAPGGLILQPRDQLMRACMASGEQTGTMLEQYRAKVRQFAGRDVPLAITEYNVGLVQEEPQPYRFAFGPALFSSDYQRILLQPNSNILMANYWHFLNGYWGAVQGPHLPGDKSAWKRYPAYFLFRLWAQHFGDQLVAANVNTPRQAFEGLSTSVKPAGGESYQPEAVGTNNLLGKQVPAPSDVKDSALSLQVLEGGVWRITARNLMGEKYLGLLNVKAPVVGQNYILRFQARSSEGWKGTKLGLSLIDSRGWEVTQSGTAVEGAENSRGWTSFEGRFEAHSDSPGASLVWRILAGTEPVSGTFDVRDVQVLPLTLERFPAYALLTAAASRSSGGKKLFVMVFNKDAQKPISTTINLSNFRAKRARRWVVTGPDLASDNRKQELVREVESGVETPLEKGALKWSFPPRSMTALEIE